MPEHRFTESDARDASDMGSHAVAGAIRSAPLPTLTIDELAEIFRRERSTMERTWKRWRRDYGFPDPLPDQAVRLWSRDAVLAWIADPTGYAYCAKFTAPGTPERALVDHARQALEKKYASAA